MKGTPEEITIVYVYSIQAILVYIQETKRLVTNKYIGDIEIVNLTNKTATGIIQEIKIVALWKRQNYVI